MSNDFAQRYGPWALVTGASSGIGRAFADLLARQGLNLVLVARREDRLRELQAQLSAERGVEVIPCPADLSAQEAVSNIMAACGDRDIGLLVSNAGFGLKGAHENNNPHRMDQMLMVNCRAPMQLTHAFIPRLRARGRGGILLTSSVEALMGFPYSGAYAATKAFVNSLAESLWGELRDAGVDVLSLCPGSNDTEYLDLQGIDKSRLEGMMSPQDVAGQALAALPEGPVFIAGDRNRQTFTDLAAMPRRDALQLMGENMKQALLGQ